jgi:peptide/nickel transport system substrate-binding protein
MEDEFFDYEYITTNGNDVIIKTKEPTPSLPGFLGEPRFLIMDVSVDDTNIKTEGPICTGPFKYVPRTEETIKVVKNPLYWRGVPHLDEVNFLTMYDANAKTIALKSQNVDISPGVSPSDILIFQSDPEFVVLEEESLRLTFAYMNLKGPLKDENLRKAVKSALDIKTLNDKILFGRCTPGKGPLPPALGYGFDKINDPYSYNVDRAKMFLEEGGYKDTDGDGYVEKDGDKITLNYIFSQDSSVYQIISEVALNNLKDIGIQVDLSQVESSSQYDARRIGNYDLSNAGYLTANTGDPQSFLMAQFETGGYNNVNSYSVPEVDELFSKLRIEFDEEKRVEIITNLQQVILDNPGHIFYSYPKSNCVYHKKLKGVVIYPTDYYLITKDIDIIE